MPPNARQRRRESRKPLQEAFRGAEEKQDGADQMASPVSGEGIWRSIFGLDTLFRWDVFGPIVPGVFLAVALAMLGVDWFPHHLVISQVCFGLAGLLVIAKTIGHTITYQSSGVTGKVLFAVTISVLTLVILVWTLISIENHKKQPEPVSPAPSTKAPKQPDEKAQPKPALTKKDVEQAVADAMKNDPPKPGDPEIVASARAGLVSAGTGQCGLVMTMQQNGSDVIFTPITYLLWLRFASRSNFKLVVDSYSMDVSLNRSGPWLETLSLPLKFASYYTDHPTLQRDQNGRYPQNNALAMRSAFDSLPNGGSVAFSGIYAMSTSADKDCLAKVKPLDFPTIDEALAHGLDSRAVVVGWSGFNPPQALRPQEKDISPMFYRITVHTPTDDYVSYGDFGTPGRLSISNDYNTGNIKILNTAPSSFSDRTVGYVGPKLQAVP